MKTLVLNVSTCFSKKHLDNWAKVFCLLTLTLVFSELSVFTLRHTRVLDWIFGFVEISRVASGLRRNVAIVSSVVLDAVDPLVDVLR